MRSRAGTASCTRWGGWDDREWSDRKCLASVEVLDLASPNGGWALCEQKMLEARFGLAAVVSQGVLYAIGGRNFITINRERFLGFISSVERVRVGF